MGYKTIVDCLSISVDFFNPLCWVKNGTMMKVFSSKNRSLLDLAIKKPPRFFHGSTFTNTSVIYLLTRFRSRLLWKNRA